VRIQRKWRAVCEGEMVRRSLLSHLEDLAPGAVVSTEEVERRARRLVIMSHWRGSADTRARLDRVYLGLVQSGREVDPGECSRQQRIGDPESGG
jgi:ubiquitin-protein ligase E3 C